ncbi:MAG: sugar phosphate nucleotidyltransferase [Patescibacteria group bacterium]
MRGVIIAGGKGSRLYPLTKTINKSLLPIYDKPMIYYSILMLANVGIKEILIVTGTEHSGQFINLLGSGDAFGVKLHYEVQRDPLGPADAINVAKDFARKEKIIVIFADNIFEDDIKKACQNFKNQKSGAKIFLKEVSDPGRFGVAEVKHGKVVAIEEKPKKPKSNLAVVGLYMYDEKAFDIISGLKPSNRGEYEVTDLNNHYIKNNKMTYEILNGHWTDAGTFDSLLAVNNWIAEKSKKEK